MNQKETASALLVCLSAGCAQDGVDRRMEELCKVDGGVHVFETVVIPRNRIGNDGLPDFVGPREGRTYEQMLGPEYILEMRGERLLTNSGTPISSGTVLSKTTNKIIRRSDGKVLAQRIVYERHGGDVVFTRDVGTTTRCPPDSGWDIVRRTFVAE